MIAGILFLILGVVLAAMGVVAGGLLIKYSVGLVEVEADADMLLKVLLLGVIAGAFLIRVSINFF